MPVRCVVGGCSNVITGKISLHRWPKDEKTRRLWTKFVQNTRADFTGPSQFSSICSEHFTEEDYDPSIALKEKMGLAAGKQKRTPLPGRIPTVKVPTRRSGMQSEGGAEEPGPDVRPSTSASSSEEAIPSPSGSGVLSQPVRKKPRLSSERRQRKEKNEVSSSNAMELEGLKRAMRWMIDTGMLSGLAIECIITDRHLQVSKWIRENLTILGITHFYDVWHIAKSIKKKLKALGKQKGCGAVMDWTQSIINHLYWCASSTPTGDPQMMLEKFLSIENHIQNKHSGHPGELFVECAHEPIPAEAERTKAWLEPGTEPCEKLSAVLNQTHLKNDVKKMSPKEQTSSIEAFHSLILHFAPKQLVFSYEGMTCRTLLAALHYNENSGRCQARSSEGKTAFKLDFPRAKCGGYTLRKRLVKATFGYVDDLLSEVHRLLERGDQTQLDPESRISSPPPTLSSSHEGPTLEDAIRKHYTRFSSL